MGMKLDRFTLGIIIGVLLANFIVDIAYVLIDPRTRAGMQGAAS